MELHPLTTNLVSYHRGIAGGGKTTEAVRILSKGSPLVLCHTHKLVRKTKKDYPGVEVRTYQSFFRMSLEMCRDITLWDVGRMSRVKLPERIIWDECCGVPEREMKVFIQVLLDWGVPTVYCGDEAQTPPVDGVSPHNYIESMATYVKDFQKDYRSINDPEFAAFKSSVRGVPNSVQLTRLLEWGRKRTFEELYDSWKPGDRIITGLHNIREEINGAMFRSAKGKIPMIYRGRSYPHKKLLKGDIRWTARDECKSMGTDWDVGYSETIHGVQGSTIDRPSILWIVAERSDWDNLIYTAVTRPRYGDQVRVVVRERKSETVLDDEFWSSLLG